MNNSLKQRLGNKPVLLVDDEYYTVHDYWLRLKDVGVEAQSLDSLDEAQRLLQDKPQAFALVLIDLNMPSPTSPTLAKHASTLGLHPTSRNHGRSLGYWLWQEREQGYPPYCYLSAVPHLFGESKGEFQDQHQDFVLNKAAILASELPAQLEKVLTAWVNLRSSQEESHDSI